MFDKTKVDGSGGGKNTTLVSENCEIKGDITFTGELVVSGKVNGNIQSRQGSKAVVRVLESGDVRGGIAAPNIIVNGNVQGDISSDGHIELAARARVQGNVHYNLVEMVKGSVVEGNLLPADKAAEQNPGNKNNDADNGRQDVARVSNLSSRKS